MWSTALLNIFLLAVADRVLDGSVREFDITMLLQTPSDTHPSVAGRNGKGNFNAPGDEPLPGKGVTSEQCSRVAALWKRKAKELHKELDELQNPADCACARQMEYIDKNEEGFACMVHWVGFSLMMGMMSERTVTPTGDMAYCPENASRQDFLCLFDSMVAPCMARHKESNQSTCAANDTKPSSLHDRYGTIFLKDTDVAFAQLLGTRRKVSLTYEDIALGEDNLWYRTGVMSSKYLTMGNFWFRSQVQGWAWKLKPEIKRHIASHHLTARLKGTPYIGVHMRKSDNVKDKIVQFSLDMESAMTLTRAISFAESIRDADPRMSTIFLLTDSEEVIEEAEELLPELQSRGWRMHWNPKVIRANNTDKDVFDWFQSKRAQMGMDIILDIELLHHADYLIGPMSSNVYRLGVELNFARRVLSDADHPTCDADRYYYLDMPWYQDF